MAVLIMPFIQLYTKSFTDAVYVRDEIAFMFVLVGIAQNIQDTVDNAYMCCGSLNRRDGARSLK